MRNNIIRYLILVVFALLQAQLFANHYENLTAEKKSFKEPTTEHLVLQKKYPSLYYDFTKNTVTNFYDESGPFTLHAEVLNNGCFTGNSNLVEARFILTNITTQSITLSNRTVASGNKIRLVESSGFDIEGFASEGILPPVSYYNTTTTIQPGGTLILKGKFAASTTSEELQASLKIDYASFTYSTLLGNQISGSVIQTLQAAVKIYRIPAVPTAITKVLHPQSYYTVGSASGLSNLEKYEFYYNNLPISNQTPLKFDAQNRIAIGVFDASGNIVYNFVSPLQLQYSIKNNQCESAKGNINLSLDTSTKPIPGSITQSVQEICVGGSVTFNFGTSGSGGGTGTGSYSWEVSYDNGNSWELVVASSLIQIGVNSLFINGLSQNIQVRRKYLVGSNLLNYAYTTALSVHVINNEIQLPNNWAIYYVKQGDIFTLPTATSTYPSNIVLTNQVGVTVSTHFLAPNTSGEYIFTYTATAIVGNTQQGYSSLPCVSTRAIKIVVYDVSTCNLTKKRTFATKVVPKAGLLAGIANPNNIVNNDRAQFATLSSVLDLLGLLGSVSVDLYFTKPDGSLYSGSELRGKKVVVKLGEKASVLKLIGGVNIRGRLSNAGVTTAQLTSSNAINVGGVFNVKGGVLDLLKGDNVFEYSFSPAETNGNSVDFNGIRIELSSTLAIGDGASVFYAYIEEDEPIGTLNNPCQDLTNALNVSPPSSANYPTVQKGNTVKNINFPLNSFVEDVFWGNYTQVLNVASALSLVNYPYYAVDNDYNSYAVFNTTIGALNRQFVNVKLRRDARPGDKVQIVLGNDALNLLNLSLLNMTGYKISFYYQNNLVGSINLNQFKLLDLGLLRLSSNQKVIISAPATAVFDHIQLEQTNTVNVNLGKELYIYDIRINPSTLFIGQTDPKLIVNLCAADHLKIQKFDFCTDYEISFAEATFNTNDQLRDENNNLMVDSNGSPMYSITAVNDISDSDLGIPVKIENNIAYYDIKRLFSQVGDKLLVKIQTKRNGCNHGDPHYLRVKVVNCIDAVVNPVIKTGGSY